MFFGSDNKRNGLEVQKGKKKASEMRSKSVKTECHGNPIDDDK